MRRKWILFAVLGICSAVMTSCSESDNSSSADTSALVQWQAGKTVTVDAVQAYGGIDKCFAAEPIPDDVWARMQGKTYKENPYIKTLDDGSVLIQPITGKPYTDRSWDFPYKIAHEDLCFKLFTEAGFEWGGDWTTRKDYQHFEIVE